jgi:hypothetical protein
VRAESPLPVTDRQAFAARIVDPENTNEDDEGDAALAERDFKPVLDAICDPAATFAKLEAADSPLRRAADDPELAFTVVDARAEDVLGRKRAFAVVRGDHVFAIYEPGAIPQQGALVVAVRRAQSFSSCR